MRYEKQEIPDNLTDLLYGDTERVKSFSELKAMALSICSFYELNPSIILDEIKKLQILAEAKRSYNRTGKYLPKELRTDLAKRFNKSESDIQRIVYNQLSK